MTTIVIFEDDCYRIEITNQVGQVPGRRNGNGTEILIDFGTGDPRTAPTWDPHVRAQQQAFRNLYLQHARAAYIEVAHRFTDRDIPFDLRFHWLTDQTGWVGASGPRGLLFVGEHDAIDPDKPVDLFVTVKPGALS